VYASALRLAGRGTGRILGPQTSAVVRELVFVRVAPTRPPVFTSLDLGAAYERSLSEQKLLLVDATAPWCGPCRMMDRTTWLDAGVVAWIDAHAIAFQLDVDAHSAAARKLRVTAMPTVMAFRDGEEIDRVVGFQKAEQLLAWLDGLTRGVTSLDRMCEEVATNPSDASLRLRYAGMLLEADRIEDAKHEYAWFWKHGRRLVPSYLVPMFTAEQRSVARAHPSIRIAIAQIRDELVPGSAPSAQDLRDWLVLNDVLDDVHRSLHWFDEHYDRLTNTPEIAAVVEEMIGPLLLGAHRWRDARALYGKELWRTPVRELASRWKDARRRLNGRH
jgi:thioredoxin 1